MKKGIKQNLKGYSALLVSPSISLSLLMGTLMLSATASPNAGNKTATEGTCPVTGLSNTLGNSRLQTAKTNKEWWPNSLDISILHQNTAEANPLGSDFDYPSEFAKLDLDAVKKDLKAVMRTSQDWWPADFGHYGPFFVRMAWHSAGTYRAYDGRGGTQYGLLRLAPQNSWPDNGNLDKARRLIWPVKQKYGKKISWADLMILAGTTAIEDMGLKTFGFGGGRIDVYEPQNDIYWGPETKWLSHERHDENGVLDERLAADELGLIYVNPEGPQGNPDPLAAAARIRETFSRMGMNDEETVALIAGGHTFGKAHGAAKASKYVGAAPEGAALEEQGFGWKNSFGSGNAADTITSGLEGSWTSTPAKWSHQFFSNLYAFEWVLTASPNGAKQWKPKGDIGKGMVPDAHNKDKRHAPMMFTTDIALREDPAYNKISKHFLNNPSDFDTAFAKAWFKLTHRDLGNSRNLLGTEVPAAQLWQDPLPKRSYDLISSSDADLLKKKIFETNLSISELVKTAWASAATYRQSDHRGGTDGGRVRLSPQKDWPVNQPKNLAKVLTKLEEIQQQFNKEQSSNKKVSIADLIILGGSAAIEKAAENAGTKLVIPFTPGRVDATQEQTDVASFAHLEPRMDGFRNFLGEKTTHPAPERLVNHAQQLTLTAPEMTVLIGGMRSVGAITGYKRLGSFSPDKNKLSNDFFTTLLDMEYAWQKSKSFPGYYEGIQRKSGQPIFAATSVDLIFGSNSQLRAISEVYASADANEKFLNDFATAWVKVMNLGR